MRVGVVGGGYWGSKHIRVLASLGEVDRVALIEPVEARRDQLVSAFSNVDPYRSLEEALPHVDALIIATKPTSHVDLGLACLEAGKHVLVEKPLATTVADANKMIEVADANDLTLMVGHTFEYNPVVTELKDRIIRGDLGEIRYIDCARLNLGLYQSDVNVIWDLAPHDVSIMNYLLDSTPTAVAAWGSSHASSPHEDVAYVRVDYERVDVDGYVHVSWLDPDKVRRVTIVGSEKMAVYNDMNTEERLRIYDRGINNTGEIESLFDVPLSYRYGDIVSPHIPFGEPLAIEDRHFVQAILNGTRPRSDGHSGLAVVATLEAAAQSLRAGRKVQIDLDLQVWPENVIDLARVGP